MGGYGCFPVRKKQDYGSFLNWGLGRDLFLPKRFYRTDFEEGDKLVVRLDPRHVKRSQRYRHGKILPGSGRRRSARF